MKQCLFVLDQLFYHITRPPDHGFVPGRTFAKPNLSGLREDRTIRFGKQKIHHHGLW